MEDKGIKGILWTEPNNLSLGPQYTLELKLLKDTSKHEHVIIESNNKGKWVIAVKKGLVLQQACFKIEL